MSATRRRHLIEQSVRSAPIVDQGQLVEMLREHGIETTQATVSRDLAAIGALKGPQGYVLPDGESVGLALAEGDEFAQAIRDHALTVTPAHAMVVVQTAPGHADLLGVALDRKPPRGVVGCIAGDDTVFLATTGPATARRIVEDMQDILSEG